MDYKAFITQITRRSEIDTHTCADLVAALSSIIKESCGNLDSVAIPRLGTFSAEKHNEREAIDASGRRMLLPPEIVLEFTPGSMLKKAVCNG